MNLTLQDSLHNYADKPAPHAVARRQGRFAARDAYLRLLTLAFALFSSVRVVAYLPTIWAIHQSGETSQHSIWTWVTWAGANMTMAAWLYEQNDQRLNRAIVVSLCNAAMCAAITALIAFHRWS
jgi:hypothetical protein